MQGPEGCEQWDEARPCHRGERKPDREAGSVGASRVGGEPPGAGALPCLLSSVSTRGCRAGSQQHPAENQATLQLLMLFNLEILWPELSVPWLRDEALLLRPHEVRGLQKLPENSSYTAVPARAEVPDKSLAPGPGWVKGKSKTWDGVPWLPLPNCVALSESLALSELPSSL